MVMFIINWLFDKLGYMPKAIVSTKRPTPVAKKATIVAKKPTVKKTTTRTKKA
jgi:hypothetical protein